jgi:hypothetical protein
MTPSGQSGDTTCAGSAELMYVRCSTCGVWMDVKPGQASGVTHSICPDCLDKALHNLDREDEQHKPS